MNTSMDDVNKHHSQVYQRFLNERHTWKKHIRHEKYENRYDIQFKTDIILTAVYVPHHVENIEVRISWSSQYDTLTCINIADSHESNTSLESILENAKQLPDYGEIDMSVYKRIKAFEPFVYIPAQMVLGVFSDEHIEFYYPDVYVEYYEVKEYHEKRFPRGKYPKEIWSGDDADIVEYHKFDELSDMDYGIVCNVIYEYSHIHRGMIGYELTYYWNQPNIPAVSLPKLIL